MDLFSLRETPDAHGTPPATHANANAPAGNTVCARGSCGVTAGNHGSKPKN
jgi:hypothetical protein